MPTYGYRCTACGHEFERVQKMTDPRLTNCEACDGPVKKILYPVGIAFKGDGFYVTDYKKDGGSKGSASATETKTESTTTETKTETKVEAKTDTAPKSETKTESKPSA